MSQECVSEEIRKCKHKHPEMDDKQVQAIAHEKCRKGDSTMDKKLEEFPKKDQDDEKKETCEEGETYSESEGRCVPKTDSVIPTIVPTPPIPPKQDSESEWKQKYDSLKQKFDVLMNSLLSNVFEQKHLDSMCPTEKLAAYQAAIATQKKLQDSLKATAPLIPEAKTAAPPLVTHTDAGEVEEYKYDYGIKGEISKTGQTMIGGRKL